MRVLNRCICDIMDGMDLFSKKEAECDEYSMGCTETVHSALEKNFSRRGLAYPRTFYFPTIGEYAPILEEQGFRVEYAVLFDRPTPQKSENGLEDWIRMFVKTPFEGISDPVKAVLN